MNFSKERLARVHVRMAEHVRRSGGRLQTFAIGVEAQDFNELPFARLVADHCGTQHHEEIASPDIS